MDGCSGERKGFDILSEARIRGRVGYDVGVGQGIDFCSVRLGAVAFDGRGPREGCKCCGLLQVRDWVAHVLLECTGVYGCRESREIRTRVLPRRRDGVGIQLALREVLAGTRTDNIKRVVAVCRRWKAAWA